ncbi:MAG: hypothetical protein RBT15_08115 [Gudongella sp.]|nr:hypothetical protein [Gudongella sp.]
MEGKVNETKSNSYVNEEDNLISWLIYLGKTGVRSLPQMAASLAIKIGIVILFQLVFWWEGIARHIPSVIKKPVIFLTATYNDVIPKTLYWIIIFTFGIRLFNRIKEKGFSSAMKPLARLLPEVKRSYGALGDKALSLLLLGGGLGLIIANNFASYSRFSGARNKMDKYFIALVISFTISYLMGEGRKHWIFKFNRLLASDLSGLLKIENRYNDNYTYLLLSGLVLGLLADAPLILMKLKYGGYILGLIAILAGVALPFLALGKVGDKK